MIPGIKSELRKLLTVRSTYITVSLALVLVALFAYTGTSSIQYQEPIYPEGVEVSEEQQRMDQPYLAGEDTAVEVDTEAEGSEYIQAPVENYVEPVDWRDVEITTLRKETLIDNLQIAMLVTATLVTVLVILLLAHEFRYNTINYTLTISNSRSKVLASKFIVMALLTVLVTLLALGVSAGTTLAAVEIKNLTLPAQDYNWWYIVGRYLLYALGVF